VNAAVNLHLKNHCIETEAKKMFRKMMDDYFTTDDESGVFEEKISLLREFIEGCDFCALRASDMRLSGEVESNVELKRNSRGKIDISIM
jgi:hypothetical protein